MLFNDMSEISLNITDHEALTIRERELAKGAYKVNIIRVHSQLIRIEIFKTPVLDITAQVKRLN